MNADTLGIVAVGWITISAVAGIGYVWLVLHMRHEKLRQSEVEDWLERTRRTGRM
jgi:hypothetical protein